MKISSSDAGSVAPCACWEAASFFSSSNATILPWLMIRTFSQVMVTS